MNSIRSKLFIQIGAMIIIMIGLIYSANLFLMEPYYKSITKTDLLETYNTINAMTDYSSDENIQILANFESTMTLAITITDSSNNILYITHDPRNNERLAGLSQQPPMAEGNMPPVLPPLDDVESVEEIPGYENIRFIWITDPVLSGENLILTGFLDTEEMIILRIPWISVKTNIDIANNFTLFFGGLALVLSLLMAYWMSMSFTKPIVAMSETTKRMKQLDFTEGCPVSTNDEIGILAGNINELSATLSKSDRYKGVPFFR